MIDFKLLAIHLGFWFFMQFIVVVYALGATKAKPKDIAFLRITMGVIVCSLMSYGIHWGISS